MKPSPAELRLEMVREFMSTFGQLMCRTFNDCSNSQAYARGELLREEYRELGASTSRVDALDAYVDMEYIAAGTQLALGLKRVKLLPCKSTHVWIARALMELTKSQLCQRGLVNTHNGLRAILDKEANAAFKDFHGAFEEVHRNNMKKMWKGDELSQAPPEATGELIKGDTKLWIVRRPDGKILKPPGHEKPNLLPFV